MAGQRNQGKKDQENTAYHRHNASSVKIDHEQGFFNFPADVAIRHMPNSFCAALR